MSYRPILAANRLADFHHSLMRTDGYGVSGSSYAMCVGCDCVRVQDQFGLESEWLAVTKQEHIQHTLKT